MGQCCIFALCHFMLKQMTVEMRIGQKSIDIWYNLYLRACIIYILYHKPFFWDYEDEKQ